MIEDIFSILQIPRDSDFETVRNYYKIETRLGRNHKLKESYKEFCKTHEQENRQYCYKKLKFILKIVFGLCYGAFPLYITYLEGFENITQFILIFICSLYLFCSGWGIEALSKIELQKFLRIPLIGLALYIILKLGIGIAIGGVIVLFKVLSKIRSWSSSNTSKESWNIDI